MQFQKEEPRAVLFIDLTLQAIRLFMNHSCKIMRDALDTFCNETIKLKRSPRFMMEWCIEGAGAG